MKAMSPYRDHLVIVGAWCHRLLQFHRLATPLTFDAPMTEDTDIATPDRLPVRSISLGDALVAGGFHARLFGDGQSPVTRYYANANQDGLHLEFISQLQGSGYKRNGEPNDLLTVSGITAQRLRHVDLLVFEPWELELSESHGFNVGSSAISILVANPASYLAQKVLTLRRRSSPSKRAKDALYIHDTVAMFGGSCSDLRPQAARVLERLARKTRREFHQLRAALSWGDDVLLGAARIATATGRANPPSAGTIGTVCADGLALIFGDSEDG